MALYKNVSVLRHVFPHGVFGFLGRVFFRYFVPENVEKPDQQETIATYLEPNVQTCVAVILGS